MGRKKSKTIASSDGWSTVVNVPSARPTGITPLNTLMADLSISDPSPSSARATISYETLHQRYINHSIKLRQSQNWQAVMEFVSTVLLPNVTRAGAKKRKCVCLGLGSMESDSELAPISMMQLALLLGVLEGLGWVGKGNCH